MKVSFITTVLNEESSIAKLLDSLATQNIKVDEVVIVDAGSVDSTLSIIDSYKNKLPIRLHKKKGNRSVGRNFAISKSKNNLIVVTDAGCVAHKNWLKEILKPFESKDVDVVAGFYKPLYENIFQKSLATYTCVPEEKVTNDFLPSSRSVAFKKAAWKKVGGYPEELDTCEDLVYARKLKKMGFKFEVAKNAVVYWPQRKDIISAAQQFYSYAKGDGQALYIRFNTPLLFGRYVVAVTLLYMKQYEVLVVLFLLYILWSVSKNYGYVNSRLAFLYLPVLQFVSDLMVMVGFIVGLLKRFN